MGAAGLAAKMAPTPLRHDVPRSGCAFPAEWDSELERMEARQRERQAVRVAERANYRTALEFLAELSGGWVRQLAVDVLSGADAEMASARIRAEACQSDPENASKEQRRAQHDDALTGDVELLGSHA